MSTPSTLEETVVRPKQRRRTRTRPKRQPPYAVVLHNDPVNGFEFVVRVLRKVFGYPTEKAFQLTMQSHTSGRSHVWTGALEVAELKADQIRSCGPDPWQSSDIASRLSVSVEPLPCDE